MRSNVTNKFICAFRGRRDDYQVPIALHEISLLQNLITDFYSPSFIAKVFGRFLKFETRFNPLLPGDKVMSMVSDFIKLRWYKMMGHKPNFIYSALDKNYSIKAAKLAARTQSSLFLYSPYAWEAFTHTYTFELQKILFQYHPHGALEREILQADIERNPEFDFNIQHLPDSGLALSTEERKRLEEVWRYSDKIICASTFTKNSLVHVGASPEKCFVVPYGIETREADDLPLFEEFTFLFVGSGVQRKGLHILLQAWEQTSLYKNSRLLIISRNIEETIRKRIPKDRNVIIRTDVAKAELMRIYSQSHLFVMPSLLEGFGHVFLEALSCGCPVLGTENTCLPDIGKEKDGIFITEAGNRHALSEKLLHLREQLLSNDFRTKARETARRSSWITFRRRLQSIILNRPIATAEVVS